MTTSVQVSNSDDLSHIGKPISAIEPNILYGVRRERPSDDDLKSVLHSNKDLSRDISVEGTSYLEDLQSCASVIKPHIGRHSLSPPSPCLAVSQECLAMASACSHDHDYTTSVSEEYSPCTITQEPFRRRSISPAVIVKQCPSDSISSSVGRKTGVAGQIRSRRIVVGKKTTADIRRSSQKYSSEVKRPIPPERRKDNVNDSKIIREKRTESTGLSILTSDREVNYGLLAPNTPDSKGSKDPRQFGTMSPRPSMTPFPPTERRRNRNAVSAVTKKNASGDRITEEGGADIKKEPDVEFSDSCKTSVDSAYNSLSCSSLSKCRTPSESRPPSGGKRSATCGLTSSSSSGASSDEWSDLDTPRPSERIPTSNEEASSVVNDFKQVDSVNVTLQTSISEQFCPPRSGASSGRKVRRQSGISNFTLEETSNETEKVQFTPTPPSRKPKKGKFYRSVPMKLRALPKSFWEEPNRTNASHYTILPPVQPLFHQHENEDIADIKPVTPPKDKDDVGTRPTISATGCDRTHHCTVIRTGDTDLLLRLFDQVELRQNQTGVRAKRGRPKRPSYSVSPSSRRAQNDNPCVMSSITEKLFPKLTLDNRYPIAAMVTSSGILASATPIRPSSENSHEGTKMNHTPKITPGSNEYIANGSGEDSPSSSITFVPEKTTDMLPSSPSATTQERPFPILPQLVGQKEYSHLLNELAAVL